MGMIDGYLSGLKKARQLAGIIILVIDVFVFVIDGDIPRELFVYHRPLGEIRLRDIVFPLVALIIALFLIFGKSKKKKNEKAHPHAGDPPNG